MESGAKLLWSASMGTEQIKLQLIPAPNDAALNSPEYQAELDAFYRILRSRGVVAQRVLEGLEAAAVDNQPAVWLGQFVVATKAVTPIIAAVMGAIGGYFHGKHGRGISFEIGKDGHIKGSAQSLEDAEKLL
jgi:hypothetical protein